MKHLSKSLDSWQLFSSKQCKSSSKCISSLFSLVWIFLERPITLRYYINTYLVNILISSIFISRIGYKICQTITNNEAFRFQCMRTILQRWKWQSDKNQTLYSRTYWVTYRNTISDIPETADSWAPSQYTQGQSRQRGSSQSRHAKTF